MAEQPQTERVSPAAGSLAGSSAGAPARDLTAQEEPPRVVITRGRIIASLLFVVGIVVFLYFGLPKLVGFGASIKRLRQGDAGWLGGAAILEFLSFCGYVALFRAVFVRRSSRIGWNASYQITMAGLAATRLFAAAGAGGIALTAWALRRSGMERRLVASRMIAFMALLYGVYMTALVADGVGLYLGLWPGGGSFAITIVPALLGLGVIAIFLAISLLPRDADRLMSARAAGDGFTAGIARRLATGPTAAATGVRTALALIRGRDAGLLGAVAWWGFDIATLWACFHAFGYHPHTGVVVMAYFVGWIGNTLPLPGGIGGVEGGLIGAFTVFGVGVQGAVVAVLAYRAFSFWLPTLPGAVAYFQLRRTVRAWDNSDGAPAAAAL
ncbi:MAG: lysylphosphatidylglycerol synthase transmembrane domain-containing protein [Solirubrobacteraceae bacterium]